MILMEPLMWCILLPPGTEIFHYVYGVVTHEDAMGLAKLIDRIRMDGLWKSAHERAIKGGDTDYARRIGIVVQLRHIGHQIY
jgi:hypothetical protein